MILSVETGDNVDDDEFSENQKKHKLMLIQKKSCIIQNPKELTKRNFNRLYGTVCTSLSIERLGTQKIGNNMYSIHYSELLLPAVIIPEGL